MSDARRASRSEKQKMLAGELYDAGDPELVRERERARRLTRRLDASEEDDLAGRAALLASGAVVRRDVPDRVVVGGNPARVLRTL